jgi:hypothetical protein
MQHTPSHNIREEMVTGNTISIFIFVDVDSLSSLWVKSENAADL